MSLCPICEEMFQPPTCSCGYVHPAFRHKNQTEIKFDIDFWGGWQFGVGLFSGCAGVVFKYTLLLALLGTVLRVVLTLLGMEER